MNVRHAVAPYLQSELANLRSFIAVDEAHTVMLAEQGILTARQAGLILVTLREIDRLGPERFPADPQYGSLLLQIERFISDRVGEEIAGRMHTGRSRNDQSAAVSRLTARDALLEILETLLNFQTELAFVAQDHLHTQLPGYTHLQHAQPTTLAHYLMRHWFTFERDQQRLEGAFERSNLSALGGAAMAGTSWPLDRQRVSDLLGHERPVENAYDAGIFARDYPSENAAVLSILVNNVGRLAGDLYLWSTWEFGFVELDDSMAGTSSIMPQKKNPHTLERIRGLAGRSVGWLPATLGMLRSVSSSDLELLFGGDPLPEMRSDALSVIELMRVSLETMRFDRQRMRERTTVNWSTATSLADEIVRQADVPFRAAHRIVARFVRLAIERGIPPEDVRPSMLDEAAIEAIGRPLGLASESIVRALDPQAALDGLATDGSAHPEAVAQTISTAHQREALHRKWLKDKRSRVEDAFASRRARADELIHTSASDKSRQGA